jgi:aspartate oxidase
MHTTETTTGSVRMDFPCSRHCRSGIQLADYTIDAVMPIAPWTSFWVGGVTVGCRHAPTLNGLFVL